MNYRNLGASGLKVSEISLGSWTTYGGSVGVEDSSRIVRQAFDAGVNLFDTADVYVKGEAEKALGAAIRGLPREQLVIATKCMGRTWDGPLGRGLSRKHIFESCDRSLQRLGVDYIDLYQFHAPDPETPLEESLRAFEDLVCIGKVLHVGFSNFDHHPKELAKIPVIQKQKDWMPMISSQPRWSLVDRHVEPEHVAFCKKHGIGMIVYSPLAQGVLTNKYAGGATPAGSRGAGAFAHFLTSEKALTPENIAAAERFAAWCSAHGLEPAAVAIAWVLRHDVVSSAIVGATSPQQLEQNLRALEVKLSDAEWRQVEAAIAGPRPARASRAATNGRAPADIRQARVVTKKKKKLAKR